MNSIMCFLVFGDEYKFQGWKGYNTLKDSNNTLNCKVFEPKDLKNS
jgi:hypothetical protein